MMFFKKKKKEKNTTQPKAGTELQKKLNQTDIKYEVIDQCEQVIDASRELEDIRSEYGLVTSYLNDIQIIEELPEDEMHQIRDTAGNIMQLNAAKNEFLKTEHQITDAQFTQIQEQEDSVPDAIKRLQANEAYLDTIKRDLNYLEGEKIELGYQKERCKKKQKQLQRLAFFLLGLFAVIVFLLLLMKLLFQMETETWMIFAAFLATVSGVFTLVRYQDYGSEIRNSEAKMNHAISLENHVKIKYVNIKNAVDYVYEKYHVKNSYEFIFIWEKYNEAVKKREKEKQTDDDLEYFNNKLIRMLHIHQLYDSKVWINHANALYDKKEMVEVKHNLLIRRQKLRTRMEYNMDVIRRMKSEIEKNSKIMGAGGTQIREIIAKLDTINGFQEPF